MLIAQEPILGAFLQEVGVQLLAAEGISIPQVSAIQLGLGIDIVPFCSHLHWIDHVALAFHMLDVSPLRLLVKAREDTREVHDVPEDTTRKRSLGSAGGFSELKP